MHKKVIIVDPTVASPLLRKLRALYLKIEVVMEAFSFPPPQDKTVYAEMFIKRCVRLGIYPVEQYTIV